MNNDIKHSSLCVFLTVVLMLLAGRLMAADAHDELLVTANWLARHLDRPALIVLDTRPEADYLAGHIPGAVNVPVSRTFGPPPHDDMVGTISQIQSLFSAAGISHANGVVIYDSGIHKDAARMFWVLEVFGHSKVKLLNGGFPGWKGAGHRASTQAVQPRPVEFVPSVQPDRLATRFLTLLATDDPHVAIIDVRTPDEFAGKVSKSARKGHIPTAVSIPADRNLVEKEKVTLFRSFDELADLYAGVDKDRKVITYCNKGKEAAASYFVLRKLGYEVAAYDGSWHEWGNDASLPITRVVQEQDGSGAE